jgi:6-pyruvoyltetrahydropterin/6-carboxytetrahydropterin synthase
MFELSKQFRFESAHTLCREIEAESSLRLHGHSYRAEVTVRGDPHPATGMIVDLGLLDRALTDAREMLDHRFLNDVPDLGPPTMENLSRWIWRRLRPSIPNISKVIVFRDSNGEACAYYGNAIDRDP